MKSVVKVLVKLFKNRSILLYIYGMKPIYTLMTVDMLTSTGIAVLETTLTSGDVASLTTHGEILIPDTREFESTGFSRVFESRLKTLSIMSFLTSDKVDMTKRREKIMEFVAQSEFPDDIKEQLKGTIP